MKKDMRFKSPQLQGIMRLLTIPKDLCLIVKHYRVSPVGSDRAAHFSCLVILVLTLLLSRV